MYTRDNEKKRLIVYDLSTMLVFQEDFNIVWDSQRKIQNGDVWYNKESTVVLYKLSEYCRWDYSPVVTTTTTTTTPPVVLLESINQTRDN